ncbi:MAG TPA: GYF domain-containing protein [Verrucomicrobiae bacterium]|nr:GYF domain-containing protein [Verrucomicrobiae bacterium]
MYKIKGADHQEYGPATADQVRQWIAERRANEHTLAQAEGSPEWIPLAAFSEFAEALRGVAGVARPIAPSPAGPALPRTNPMAVAGLVLGAISLLGGWICCCGSPLAILGIVFSTIALNQISSHPSSGSKRMALVGLALSILGLIAGILLPVVVGFASQGQNWRRPFGF